MEKKKLKLSISGASKKTINSIEQARSQSKNSVVIEKRSPRFGGKTNFSRGARPVDNKSQSTFIPKKQTFLNLHHQSHLILKKESWQNKEQQED